MNKLRHLDNAIAMLKAAPKAPAENKKDRYCAGLLASGYVEDVPAMSPMYRYFRSASGALYLRVGTGDSLCMEVTAQRPHSFTPEKAWRKLPLKARRNILLQAQGA